MDLRGRVALVTGSARRVGRVIALALAREGMNVAIHHHSSPADAETAAREARELGVDARVFTGDLRDAAAAERLIKQVSDAFGGLDVLVNSAASMMRTPIGEVTVAQWDEIFALNLRAPFFLSQAAARRLAERRGAIVNIADLAAFETWPGYIPHGISKAAVVQMTRALARVLAPDVRVNAVAPGAVLLPDDWDAAAGERLAETTPLKRLGSPEDVAQTVVFLLRSDYITGETIVVDGGRRVRGATSNE